MTEIIPTNSTPSKLDKNDYELMKFYANRDSNDDRLMRPLFNQIVNQHVELINEHFNKMGMKRDYLNECEIVQILILDEIQGTGHPVLLENFHLFERSFRSCFKWLYFDSKSKAKCTEDTLKSKIADFALSIVTNFRLSVESFITDEEKANIVNVCRIATIRHYPQFRYPSDVEFWAKRMLFEAIQDINRTMKNRFESHIILVQQFDSYEEWLHYRLENSVYFSDSFARSVQQICLGEDLNYHNIAGSFLSHYNGESIKWI